MKKVVMLIPCLMRDYNREANHKAMAYALQNYELDEYVVDAQEFSPEDYREGFTYIGHHSKGVGLVKARNELLDWFYNSDYDYAFWLDSRCKISKTSVNDYLTVLRAIKEGVVDVDVILSTIGVYISGERIAAKQAADSFDTVKLIPAKKRVLYDGINGEFMVNFKKKYGIEPKIDERCNPALGVGEEIFFNALLRRLFDVYLAPTIVVSAGSIKNSVWMQGKASYAQEPPHPKQLIRKLVEQNASKIGDFKKGLSSTIILNRVEDFKDKVTPYKPKSNFKLKSRSLLDKP